jgi:hypothetical protein
MVEWEYRTNPREASGLDPEAVHTLAGSDCLEAADQDGNALRVQLPEITPQHVTIRFPFADLAGIGYRNGWLAACRDSGCIVDTTNHG